ncbi:oligosaccharyl transferase stt3 subunit [Tulasnella sp. 332]|nr:oligosaccharyl transferase stt3 subunit [Tulasnella sp. 332]
MVSTSADPKIQAVSGPQKVPPPVAVGDVLCERYTIVKKLGGGVFATVWLVYDQHLKRHVSIKIPHDITNAEHEIAVLKKLTSAEPNHPGFEHVLNLEESFDFPSPDGSMRKCIVTEVLGPSVVAFRTASDRVNLPVDIVKQITLQLLFALNYLHQYCDVIHTDIQPANILLTLPDVEVAVRAYLSDSTPTSDDDTKENTLPFDTSDTSRVKVRLIDFGSACTASDINVKGIQPRDFRAPEVLLEAEWTSSVDIWNLGCLAYEMMTSKSLFNAEHKDDDQLQLEHMIQLLGPFPPDVLAPGKRSAEFFTPEGVFRKPDVQVVGLAALVKYALPPALSNTASLFRIVTLCLISGAAIASRLFAVITFESIIHEFDPWFNFRATKVLASEGFYEFWNWFDPTAWYPLGRVVGGTIYPGLMATSGVIYNVLHYLNLPVDVRNVCVMLAPGFSALTAWATYMFTCELKDQSAGLLAAVFIGITPGYISRSVAGSYDNEAIAIFLLMFTFYLWIRAMKDGSAFYGAVAGIFYFYMVAAWGGYVFITNMIPLHALVLVMMGRFNSRLYVGYSSWYAIGTLASMQVPFVGFQPVKTSEHMGALGVFGLLQLVSFSELVRSHLASKQFQTLLRSAVVLIGLLGAGMVGLMTMKGWIAPWTGRFYSLWDTEYAKKYIPIIASVSEHQPTAWPSFFMDLHFLVWIFPAGVFLCLKEMRDEHMFVIIYAVMASYFAGVMVRLMLTLTPVVCITAAIAVSTLLDTYTDAAQPNDQTEAQAELATIDDAASVVSAAPSTSSGAPAATPKKGKKSHKGEAAAPAFSTSHLTPSTSGPVPAAEHAHHSAGELKKPGILSLDTRFWTVVNVIFLLSYFVLHCTYVTSTAYSSPSVILSSKNQDGSMHIIDDFREAYYWLRQNTAEDSVICSWWDYGYQIAGMADRPTLVDNNTWNNTHIATVGKIMALPEDKAYPILRKHDVEYVLVIFGSLLGYSGDDINKFLWMVRISQGIWPDEIQEKNYFTPRGEYKMDKDASVAMKESVMYKTSYYKFADMFQGGRAMDRARNQELPQQGPTLDYLDEAFTSENWLVRIYQVKKDDILGRDHKTANAFADGKKRKRTRPMSRRRALVTKK